MNFDLIHAAAFRALVVGATEVEMSYGGEYGQYRVYWIRGFDRAGVSFERSLLW